jgi:superfamily II DNA/RNA helicase
LSHCSRGHQTLLFSATLSEAINDLALLSLRNPIRFNVSKNHSLPSTLRQLTVPVPPEKNIKSLINRESILLHLCLTMFTKEKTLVFFRTKKAAHRASLIFRLLSIRHAELHGNLPQSKRLEALESFHKSNSVRFLLCSELAARGLDIASVDLVINFMVPPEASRYIHQVGRTARLGRNGTCITLYSPDEKLQLKRIIRQSSKTSFPASKLIIPPNEYEGWIKKLHSFVKPIEEILSKEHLEKEIRLAEREAQKGINMHMYENEIMSRPKKTWLSKKMLSSASKDAQTNALHEETFNKMDEFVPKQCLLSSENDTKHFQNSLDDEDMSNSSGSIVNINLVSSNGKSSQTNTRFNQKSNNENKKIFKQSLGTEKPQHVNTKQVTKPLSLSERKRLIKERAFQNKKSKQTAKQKAALKERLPSKAVGSKVKRKRRLTHI